MSFMIIKKGKFLIPHVIDDIRGVGVYYPNPGIETPYGLFFPLSMNSTRIVEWMKYGDKAVVMNKERSTTGFLFGRDFAFHQIRINNNKLGEINVTMATHYIGSQKVAENFNFLYHSDEAVEDNFRIVVHDDNYTMADIHRVLCGVGNTAKIEAVSPKGWANGKSLWDMLVKNKDKDPFFHPSFPKEDE